MTDLETRIAALSPEQRRLLARRLREVRVNGEVTGANADETTPLTPGQRRLWRERQAAPNVPINVVCQVLDLDGPLDEERLERALNRVVERHAALRTTFVESDGVALQVVQGEMGIPFTREELSTTEQAASSEALDRRARALCSVPFDPARGPLVRWRLARRAPERHALLFAAHNLVFDAWSYEIFLDDLVVFYRTPDTDIPPPVSFASYVRWQRQWF